MIGSNKYVMAGPDLVGAATDGCARAEISTAKPSNNAAKKI